MRKKVTAMLLIFLLLLPAAGFAVGAELSFSGDTTAAVNDVVAVVVTFSAEETIAALQAEFTYDAEKLLFLTGGNAVQAQDGAGSISGGGGADRMAYSLEFRALRAGTATVEVTNAEVIGEETGKALGSPAGAVTIEIAVSEQPKAPTETPEQTEAPAETPAPTSAPVDVPNAETMVIDGKKYTPTDAKIAGYLLLGDEDGVLWLYRTADGRMTQYCAQEVHGLYQPLELPALAGYRATTVEIGGTTCAAYEKDDLFFVYLQDCAGEAAWYGYDAETGRLRQTQLVTETIAAEEPQEAWVTLGLGCLCAAAVVVLISVLRRKKR